MSDSGGRRRCAAAAIAGLGWFALLLQLLLLIRAATAVGIAWPSAAINFLSYFTIESNILVALVTTAAALRLRATSWLLRPAVQSAATLYIGVVGIVYVAVLRLLWAPQGWQWIADVLLHNAIPLLYLGYWAVFVPKGALRWLHAALWLVFPAGFLLYSLLRGALMGFYAYPFIDAAAIGYGAVARNALLLIGLFWGFGLLLAALDRVIARRRPQPSRGE